MSPIEQLELEMRDRLKAAKAEVDKLRAENEKLKAQLWVANDSRLRTYDGLTQENLALREMVKEAINLPDRVSGRSLKKWNTFIEKANQLLEGDKRENE